MRLVLVLLELLEHNKVNPCSRKRWDDNKLTCLDIHSCVENIQIGLQFSYKSLHIHT